VSAARSTSAFRPGLLVHGNKIWISEFLSIFFLSSILITFFTLTLLIVLDEATIRSNDRRILALSNFGGTALSTLAELSSKAKIIDAMRVVLGNRLSAQTYYQLADLVHASSSTFGYDPLLLLAVIDVESQFSAQARGQYKSGTASGAFGLMQLKLETAQEIARSLGITVRSGSDLFRPDVNIPLGVAYLTQLIAQFRSFKLGLLAYNQGPAVIRDQLAAAQPLSNDYYHRVLKRLYRFRAITDSLGVVKDSSK
jgi:soluble lytic murein transglycosylase-like protein